MDSATEALNQQAIERYAAGDRGEAISLWRAALGHSPDSWEILTYLGSALKEEGELETAAECYQQALERQPGLADVHYNLGNIRQAQGQLKDAAACYRDAIAARPGFTFAWYNLGNVFRELGQLNGAIDCYKQAILSDRGHAPSYNNLGNALKHSGDLEQAVQCYQAAVELAPDYPDAIYNLGNAWFEQGDFAAALPCFQRAQIRDAAARALYCLYKCERLAEFDTSLAELASREPHHSPQVATLAAHRAINTGSENRYRFCPSPFDLVYHQQVPELTGGDLREALLRDIRKADIEERVQGRLHSGVQSSGHLFLREEDSFRSLAKLVREHLARYRERFADSDCELIRAFPQALEFESAWYIRMRRGGHLDAHIHEGGWVSGAVYLSLPARGESGREGCFEVGLHGDDYPVSPGVEFDSRVLEISEGDIVLFPANLFHRTLPYSADTERVCVAFDLKPATGVR